MASRGMRRATAWCPNARRQFWQVRRAERMSSLLRWGSTACGRGVARPGALAAGCGCMQARRRRRTVAPPAEAAPARALPPSTTQLPVTCNTSSGMPGQLSAVTSPRGWVACGITTGARVGVLAAGARPRWHVAHLYDMPRVVLGAAAEAAETRERHRRSPAGQRVRQARWVGGVQCATGRAAPAAGHRQAGCRPTPGRTSAPPCPPPPPPLSGSTPGPVLSPACLQPAASQRSAAAPPGPRLSPGACPPGWRRARAPPPRAPRPAATAACRTRRRPPRPAGRPPGRP